MAATLDGSVATRWARRLREMGEAVRGVVVAARDRADDAAAVLRSTAADTIYAIDAEVEPVIERHCEQWAREAPLVLVAEGLEAPGMPEGVKAFPEGARVSDAAVRVIVDPIDGTRGLMYDKRSAWCLAGVAVDRGEGTRLRDVFAAAMTELPTSKMDRADVLWATRGGGARGARQRLDGGAETPLRLTPSRADRIDHGFASISNFFPGTKRLAAGIMESLAAELLDRADLTRGVVFDDQYISTGGQWHELIVGHDRFNADLRPELYRLAGGPEGMCCHPYDCAALLIAEEAGVIITDGSGAPLDGPLDVTSNLSWIGYANAALRARIEPVLLRLLRDAGAA